MGFADSILEAVRRKKSVVVAGLDPEPKRFPPDLRDNWDEELYRRLWAGEPRLFPSEYRKSRRTDYHRTIEFCCRIVEQVKGAAVAVKPQVAFFERTGTLWALHKIARFAKSQGLLVILDAKRADIGSTAEAYAEAYLGDTGLGRYIDAITVNPYLGRDAVEPFLRRAREAGKGVFVLVRTSNPSAAELQDQPLATGQPVFEAVAEMVGEWGADACGESGYSNVGAVVGATAPEQLARVRQMLPHRWILVPGYGAQGAGPLDVVAGFDQNSAGLLVNASRSILYAWENHREGDPEGVRYAEWARVAAEEMRGAINKAKPRGTQR